MKQWPIRLVCFALAAACLVVAYLYVQDAVVEG